MHIKKYLINLQTLEVYNFKSLVLAVCGRDNTKWAKMLSFYCGLFSKNERLGGSKKIIRSNSKRKVFRKKVTWLTIINNNINNHKSIKY